MTPNQKHFFIIVNYNGGDHIISAIQSILLSKNISPHIIIVDNNSSDNSLEKCKMLFPDIIYISHEKNTGFASAANTGMRYAYKNSAATITLLNPDALLDQKCMSRIIQKTQNLDPCIASPIIFEDEKKSKVWFSGGKIDFIRMRAIHKTPKNLSKPLPENSFISGCVMTISRGIIDTIGFFDEGFFLYYEDADFSLRAQKNNLELYIVENAYAYHKELSEKTPEKKTYYLVFSGLLFFKKHAENIQKPYFFIYTKLRKIKNDLDRKNKKSLSYIVHEAFNDFKKRS